MQRSVPSTPISDATGKTIPPMHSAVTNKLFRLVTPLPSLVASYNGLPAIDIPLSSLLSLELQDFFVS